MNYLDARNLGFSRDAWKRLRDVALADRYTSQAQVYRAVRNHGAASIRSQNFILSMQS